jgi:hypothetical protein
MLINIPLFPDDQRVSVAQTQPTADILPFARTILPPSCDSLSTHDGDNPFHSFVAARHPGNHIVIIAFIIRDFEAMFYSYTKR